MISVEEAKKIIGEHITPATSIEKVSLTQAYGRVLAKDVESDIDIPPFNRATMDGYAVVSKDGPGFYEVTEYVPAGTFPQKRVESGKVTRVMTGAPTPEGADAIIQVEKTGGFVEVGEKAEIKESIKHGQNISLKGEDIKAGQKVLSAGNVIEAPEMAALATVGCDPVEVFKAPKVAILSTGDELVPASQKPAPGQIRNSNSPSLFAQALALGLEPTLLGVAKDNEKDLNDKIAQGSTYDFLLISGGVSAGDKDFVPNALEQAGYKQIFHKVRVKPGKPLLFGATPGGKYVFGVPGNPVSGMVIFELFIKQAILKFSGMMLDGSPAVKAMLACSVKRKPGAREEYIPVHIHWDGEKFMAIRIRYHGSGHMLAMTHANALFKIPSDMEEVEAGYVGEIVFIRKREF